MKMNRIVLVLLSLSLTSAIGFAEEKNGGQGNSDRPWLGPKADLNKDGAIGVEEAQKAEEIWKQNHREQRQEKREEMKEKREEWKEKADVNQDGSVGKVEKHQAMEEWKENHAGPQGGPGNGPPQNQRDKDNNPPGMKGGPGSNWENKPGPQGGPGASPNRGPQGGGKKK